MKHYLLFRFTFVAVLCIISSNLFAQKTPFQINYGFSAEGLIQDSENGYTLTYAFDSLTRAIGVLKLDSLCAFKWSKVFSGSLDDYCNEIIKTTDGGYTLVGTTDSYGQNNFEVHVTKLNYDGTVKWAEIIGGVNDVAGNSIKQTSDGGYIVAGTYSFGTYGDVYLIKLDINGKMVWTETIGKTKFGQGGNRIISIKHGFVIAGEIWTNALTENIYIIRTDTIGNIIWTQIIGGKNKDVPSSIIQTLDGGYAIAGTSQSYSLGKTDAYILKLDSGGIIKWSRTIGDSGTYLFNGTFANSIQQTKGGSYIIDGYRTDTATNGLIMMLDTGGNIKWIRTLPDYSTLPDDSHLYDMIATKDGNFAVTGTDATILKFDSTGNICDTVPTVVFVTSIDSGKETTGTITSKDTGSFQKISWNIKNKTFYKDSVICGNITTTTDEVLPTANSIKMFPNPGDGLFTVEGASGKPSIKVYNILGEEVFTTEINSTINQLNLTTHPPGIYFYRIVTDDKKISSQGKLVIQ